MPETHTQAVSRLLTLMGFGAANDNLLKMGLVVGVSAGVFEPGPFPPVIWSNLAGLLFILPFVLLATTATALSHNVSVRRRLMQLKGFEVVLALLALVGLWSGSASVLLAVVAGLGVQSALLGPLKYALLPRWVTPHGLSGANACLQTITFVAILVGTAIGSFLILQFPLTLGVLCLSLALLGWWIAGGLPATTLSTDVPVESLTELIRAGHREPMSRARLHVISGFWGLGSVWLGHLTLLVADVWVLPTSLVPGILTLFVLGIGMGSGLGVLAQRLTLSFRVALGGVVIGCAGIIIAQGETISGLLGVWLTAAGGGFMVLPLYVSLQQNRGSVVDRIATLNVYNAVAMLGASLASMIALVGFGVSLVLWLALLAAAQLLLCLYHRRDLLLHESIS